MKAKRGFIVIIMILMLIETSVAQTLPPPVPPPPPPGLPLNCFSELLFIIGIVYGIKKILKDSSC